MTKEDKAILEQMYEQFNTNHNEDRALALYEALKEIETYSAVKSLHPIEWIPVTDDLPDVDEENGVSDYVLVCGNFNVPFIAHYGANGLWYDGDDDQPVDKVGIYVTAWMPLPTPYAGGRN